MSHVVADDDAHPSPAGAATAPSPRVTVIMPTYNRARFLRAAIASVLAQIYRDFELVIADDGSEDDTRAVIEEFDDSRLRYLASEHRGQAHALNLALAAARGCFVARLDSDDVWQPEILATLVPILERDDRLGFAYGRGRAMQADGAPIDHVVGYAPRWRSDGLQSLVYDDCTCNIAILARREVVVAAGGYDESLPAAEDWDLWLRVAALAPFTFVDRELASFRCHEDNLTRAGSPQHERILDSRLRVLDKFFASPAGARVAALAPLAYRNVYVFHTMQYLRTRRYRRAWQALVHSTRGARQPWLTLVRNLAFIGAQQVLMRHQATARLVEHFATFRRRRRDTRSEQC